jgi:hypothetical protein
MCLENVSVVCLGKGICDIIAVHKQIENQTNNVVNELSILQLKLVSASYS